MIRAFLLAVALAALSLWLHPAGAQVVTQQIGPATSSIGGTLKNGAPAYVVNNWYLPVGYVTSASVPATPGANKIVCNYGIFPYPATLSALGIVNTTTDNTKRFQLGIYSNGSWGRPGTLLVNTSDIALTAATGAYSGAVSVALPDGPAWFCINTESAVAVFVSLGAVSNGFTSGWIGSSTQTTIGNQSTGVVGVSVAQTYGTWPASFASNQTWSDVNTAISPYMQFKVASSP